MAQMAEQRRSSLADEWESFEKLIQVGGHENLTAERDRRVPGSSREPAADGRAGAVVSEVRSKRVFQEAESDSDGNTGSEDECHPAAMDISSKPKPDRRSSSSDSSRSAENTFRAKSASSDSESSSDDEKPVAEQAKRPLSESDAVLFATCVPVNVWEKKSRGGK